MESIKQISALMPLQTGKELRTTRSKPRLSDALVLELGNLMQQARDNFPNQTLPEGTTDIYLRAWEELALEHGIARFSEGLWKVLRSSQFFPVPGQIEDQCNAIKNTERNPFAAIEAINARYEHFKKHPEMYEIDPDTRVRIERLQKKLGIQKATESVVSEYREETCPHCSKALPVAQNIRFWTGQQLRDLADVVDNNDQIAADNRAMNKVSQ